MRMTVMFVLALGCLGVVWTPAQAQTNTMEVINFVKDDGRHVLNYSTFRSNYPSLELGFPKDRSLDEALKDVFYINPNEYRYDETSDRNVNKLLLSQGSYAMMAEADLTNNSNGSVYGNLTVNDSGVYKFSTEDRKSPDGHYGLRNTSGNFSQFVYVWVFPESFEVLAYECNRRGDWVKRHNTIAYYGKEVNDLLFTITYRPPRRNPPQK
jgi:hypothetical protein